MTNPAYSTYDLVVSINIMAHETVMKKATIHWLKPSEGGRKTLPDSTTYYATTILNHATQNWSIVIQFEKPLQIDEVDTAPYHVCRPGK